MTQHIRLFALLLLLPLTACGPAGDVIEAGEAHAVQSPVAFIDMPEAFEPGEDITGTVMLEEAGEGECSFFLCPNGIYTTIAQARRKALYTGQFTGNVCEMEIPPSVLEEHPAEMQLVVFSADGVPMGAMGFHISEEGAEIEEVAE